MKYVWIVLVIFAVSCTDPEHECMKSCKYINYNYGSGCGVVSGYSGYQYNATDKTCRCWVENK